MFENNKIFILGFARSGYEAAKFLVKRGNEVLINDGKDESKVDKDKLKELKDLGVKFFFGSHPDDLLDESYDYLIKNPGVPIHHKYIEKAEDIRHVRGNKAIYQKRKETIERIFGTAKEHHGFRYTQYIGKARMEMKAGLTFACMNLKKLARFLGKNGLLNGQKRRFLRNFWIQFNFKGKNGAGMIPAPSLSTV